MSKRHRDGIGDGIGDGNGEKKPEQTPIADDKIAEKAVDTLYFDGQCPLCAREIEQLRTLRGAALRIVDIHRVTETSGSTLRLDAGENRSGQNERAPSKDQLLRTLYLRRADGTWVQGADANVAAWEGTRSEKLWRVLRWPGIRIAVDFFYARWASWRYRRLYGEQFDEQKHAS
ncbi:MAG: thiol-disulfide oxidoreductase DCC family protein [Congregibacter sp.]